MPNPTNGELITRLNTILPTVPQNMPEKQAIQQKIADLQVLNLNDPANPTDIAQVENWERQFAPVAPDKKKSSLPWYGWVGILLAIVLGAFALYRGLTAGSKADNAQATANVALDTAKAGVQIGNAAHQRLDTVIAVANDHGRRLDMLEKTVASHGQRITGLEVRTETLAGGLQQIRQRADDQRARALAWRNSVLGRVHVLESRPVQQQVVREVRTGGSVGRTDRAATAPVETVQVVSTPGPTVSVIVRNNLTVKAKVAYESWNKVIGPNGLVILNMPPSGVFHLVATNTKTGEGWVIPVNAGQQREVTIPPH